MHPLAYRKVITILSASLSKKRISLLLNVSRWTIWRWSTKPKTEYQRRPKLTEKQESEVCEHVIGNPHLIQQDIIELISQMYNIQVSQSFVCRLLKRRSITRKRASKAFSEADELKKQQFIENIQKSTSDLIALDECSFLMNHCTSYGYAIKGDRAVIPRPGRRNEACAILFCCRYRNSRF